MENQSRKGMIAITVIALLILVTLVALNYREPSDKVFSLGGYYKPAAAGAVSPKEMFAELNSGPLSGDGICNTTIQKAENAVSVGNYVWLAEGNTKIDEATLRAYIRSDCPSDSQLMPYNEGSMIISPTTLRFVDANCTKYDDDVLRITANIGTDYIIEWEGIECWWCHIDKETKSHNTIIGAGGIYEVCSQGYIIGQATSQTVVSLYKREGDHRVPCSFVDFFFGNM